MTIILGPSANPITNMFTTELHVYKQQQTPAGNYNVFSMFCSVSQSPYYICILNITNT